MTDLRHWASEVVANLWMSGMPDPGWDLDRCGVRLVVSFSEHLPPHAARRFEWCTRGEASGDGRMLFLHWPFEDGPLPSWDACFFVSQAVAWSVRQGWVTLVHCQEGRNRSGLIAALAVRELARCSGIEAVAAVRAARSGTLSNRAFVEALENFQRPDSSPPERTDAGCLTRRPLDSAGWAGMRPVPVSAL
jgi:protein-tyrosine phosphatase